MSTEDDSVVWGVDRAPAQQELDELTAQRDQLADILTRTANALKNKPAELTQHSWHDLPEVAQQLKAAQQEPVAKHYVNGGHLVYPPAQRTWVGLTNNELQPIADEYRILFGSWVEDFARAIETKLRERNT